MCSFVEVELEGSQGSKVILVFLATITVVVDDMLINYSISGTVMCSPFSILSLIRHGYDHDKVLHNIN